MLPNNGDPSDEFVPFGSLVDGALAFGLTLVRDSAVITGEVGI